MPIEWEFSLRAKSGLARKNQICKCAHMSEGIANIYALLRLMHTTHGASVIPVGLRTLRKTLLCRSSEIGILCPFWTFTIFVLLCKVNRH